jgi:hypothetical protein
VSVLRLSLATSLLLAACTPAPPDVPPGWAVRAMTGCCTIALPPGATLAPVRDAIDDPSFALRAPQFEGTFTLSAMGSALPPATSGDNYRKSQRMIGGRTAYVAAYRARDETGTRVEKRNLLWVIAGKNDGTGRNLLFDYRCEGRGCADFDKMIDTLRVTDS